MFCLEKNEDIMSLCYVQTWLHEQACTWIMVYSSPFQVFERLFSIFYQKWWNHNKKYFLYLVPSKGFLRNVTQLSVSCLKTLLSAVAYGNKTFSFKTHGKGHSCEFWTITASFGEIPATIWRILKSFFSKFAHVHQKIVKNNFFSLLFVYNDMTNKGMSLLRRRGFQGNMNYWSEDELTIMHDYFLS